MKKLSFLFILGLGIILTSCGGQSPEGTETDSTATETHECTDKCSPECMEKCKADCEKNCAGKCDKDSSADAHGCEEGACEPGACGH